MPRINDKQSPFSSKQPFKKKSYRPWDLLGDDFIEEEQTGHKSNTNQTQNEHELDTNQTPGSVIKHKVDTNRILIKHELNTELDTKSKTNQTQNEHKLYRSTFLTLVGLQRKIILFFYENCKKTREKETEPMTLEHLAKQLNICVGSVKTTIRRLQMKNLIKRIDFKNGRSGWSRYEVPVTLFSEIIQLETEHKLNLSIYQTEHKANTELNTDLISSSSYNIYNKTTTNVGNQNSKLLPAEWRNIDIEPLTNIGFTSNHLSQIASQNKLQPQVVQDSIYAFAFDVQENNKIEKIKGDPINFFMGILRKVGPYVTPSNYESPQDKAMRIYLEKKRKAEQGRLEIEKEAINLAFNEWFSKLNDEQKIKLLPDMLRRNASSEKLGKSKMLESSAKSHFEKEIWPELKKEICVDN